MKTWTDKRTAKDPYDYVRRINQTFSSDPRGYTFTVESIDGETKTGQKRYTMRVTVQHA
jgi:hypothetical protein